MNWDRLEGGNRRCRRHDETFAALAVCPKCKSDPGDIIAPEEENSPADRELELLFQEFRTEAKFLRRISRERIEDGTAQDLAVALKASDVALKYDRAAVEIQSRLHDKRHDHWLVKAYRELLERGAH